MSNNRTEAALDRVRAERERQYRLYGDGEDCHPFEMISILGEEYGELCEAVNETVFKKPRHPERGGYANIIREATQLAAVAVQMIEYTQRAEENKRKPDLSG